MIDKLEKAYVNSTVASAAYDASCAELIAKYKTLRTVTEDSVPNVQHFMWVQFIFGTCSASESMRSIILLLICLVLLNLPWRVESEALLCFHGLGLHFRLTINCKLPLHEGHLYDALYFGSTPIASWSTCHCRTSSWALRKENDSSKCCWVCASLHRGHGYAEAEHVRFRKLTQYF